MFLSPYWFDCIPKRRIKIAYFVAGNDKTFKTYIMILLRKIHSHVWNTFIFSAILLSSCCPPPVDDEVYINIYQNMSIETIPVENVIDTCYRRSPEFFFANSAMFDKEPRGKFCSMRMDMCVKSIAVICWLRWPKQPGTWGWSGTVI